MFTEPDGGALGDTMSKYVMRRLLQGVIVLFCMSIVVFWAVRLAPGDPATTMLGPAATAEEVARMRQSMGLDRPVVVQYWFFIKKIFSGTLGVSLFYRQPVEELILEKLPATFELTLFTMLLVCIVAIPVGVVSAVRRYSLLDYLVTVIIYLGQAAPNFWVGIMLILIFSVQLKLLPSFGRDSFLHILMPATALATPLFARVARFVRSGMLEVLRKDFVRTARSKGLSGWSVVYKHAFRNVLIPLVTDTGLQFGWLLGGAVAVEVVFAWPGIGTLAVNGIQARDYPLIQAVVLTLATIFILLTLLIDIAYALVDPRIRYD